jgi:hypothetical protein
MGNALSKNKLTAPATVPSDTIIPLHGYDDNAVFRAMVINFALCFNDVLDPEKLRHSLSKLLEREGWRKLGARLRLNVNLPYRLCGSRPS